ncbi:MAG: sensor histidine kinase [Calditrichia bacterium]
MKIRTIQALLQATLWLVMAATYMNYLLRDYNLADAFALTLYALIISAIPFYLNYFYVSNFLFLKKQYFRFTMLISLILLVPVVMINFTDYGWLIVDETSYDPNIDGVSNFFFFLLLSTAFKGMETWLYNRQREAQIEKEKLQAELNFLKIQINPHFLFNTLNNIYSLAYNGDKRSAEMIAKLSAILRYMLYDCKESRVPLQKEMELIKNVINLQELKFDSARNIDLYTEGIQIEHRIAPLILVTLLENSFKHSDIDRNARGWIKISCVVERDSFEFMCSNSISNKLAQSDQENGLGLENIRKQLSLIYPGMHYLRLEKNEDNFMIKLTISLSEGE